MCPCLIIMATLAGGGGHAYGQARDAGTVLAAARAALGGDAALTAVKTVVATGRTRQIRGDNTVPIEFEIACELPDACVRREEYPAQNIDPSTIGFRGDTLIQGIQAVGASPAGAAQGPQARLAQVQNVQQEFARLLIGVFAGSVTSYPLTFSYAAEADAPEGKADVINVVGPSSFAPRLVIQRDTRLPVMLMWQAPGAPAFGPPGPPRPVGGPPGQVTAPGRGGPSASVEHRLYYADYRTVSGIKWPFRLRRAIAGSTTEETTFDRVSLNVKIDPRTFEVPK